MGWSARNIPDLKGRVAVVTGGNGGLGLATSSALAAHGATIVMGARNLAKAQTARSLIMAQTPGATVRVYELDLGSLASVATFAGEVRAAYPAVHLLFNNAGIMAPPERLTVDGFESQWGTNVLGHFALTMRLVPALLAAAQGVGEARVVFTTSMARHQAGKFDLADLQMRGHYKPWIAYGISKRAVVELAIELDRRLGDRGVHGLVGDPGLSKTDLQATAAHALPTFQHRFWHATVRVAGQPARNGALGQLRAATDPTAQGGTLYAPRLFSFGAPVRWPVRGRMADPVEHASLWEIAELETGITLASVMAGL